MNPLHPFLVCSMVLALPTRAQNQNLSGPFPGSLAGDVDSFRFLPDGGALYVADQETDEVHELYFVPRTGGEPRKLSGALVEGGDVLTSPGRAGFAATLDGTRVVYAADQETDGVLELFVVPLDGSAAPRRLNRPFGPGASLDSYRDFALSSDGARVVYAAHDEGLDTRLELHSVPLDGSAPPVQLNELAAGTTGSFDLSPDGQHVVYTANQDNPSAFELYSAPIDGSAAARKLNVPFASGSVTFRISPDSRRVVFLFGATQLLSVPIDRSGPVVTLVNQGGRYVSDYRISPDGQRVLFLGELTTDEVYELYSVPIAGGAAPLQLSGPLVAGGDVAAGFRISPNGARVVYRADQDIDDVFELYSVPLAGGTVVKLNDPLPHGRSVEDDFALGWLGQRVVYRADRDADFVFELFSAPIQGGAAAVKLNGPLAPGASVQAGFRNTEARAFYLADDADASFARELFSVPLDGRAAASAINAPLVAHGNVADFAVSADGTRVLYRAAQDVPGLYELFGASTTGAGVRRISGPIQPGPILRDVGSFQRTDDGQYVLYVVDEETGGTNDILELFRVRADGGGGRVLLANGVTRRFHIAPDGSRAVYAAATGLFSVPVAGGVGPIQIVSVPLQQLVSDWKISPDSGRVLYWQAAGNQTFELRSAPLDGSQTAVILGERRHAPSVAHFAAQGRVLFTSASGLYSVPLDGGAAPLLLNPNAVDGSLVLELQLSAEGSLAVYRADQDVLGRPELYAVPVDGSAPPSPRSGLLSGEQEIQGGFQLHADGAIFYHRTSLSTGHRRHSLWSVAAQGSGAPVRLTELGRGTFGELRLADGGARVLYTFGSSTIPWGLFSLSVEAGATPLRLVEGALDEVLLTTDGEFVVFRADLDLDGVLDLYRVAVDGRGAPTPLSAALAVRPGFQLDPHDRHVVFPVGRELYCAPLDGHAPPARLHPSLPHASAVQLDFVVTPRRVFYRADQEQPGVFELFLSALPPSGRPAGPLPRVLR